MLQSLLIKNFALIDEISIDFSDRLNIFTGETGAGKSILIDALRFCLGHRIKTSQIRNADMDCLVEAVLNLPPSLQTHKTFTDLITSDDSTLIIKRVLKPDGKTQVKINGLTITVAQLKHIGQLLIDFHGPHDHQLLLSQEEHIRMLDQLIDFQDTKNTYLTEYQHYKNILQQLHDLSETQQSKEREIDLLSHQIQELEQVNLNEEHYQYIQQEQTKISNQEKLVLFLQDILQKLSESSPCADELLSDCYRPITQLIETDPQAEHIQSLFEQTQNNMHELIHEIKGYTDSLSFDAQHAQDISQEFDAYIEILRKYGPSIEDAQIFYSEAKTKYDNLINFEANNQKLLEDKSKSEKQLTKLAKELHNLRQKTSQKLTQTIENELKELGFQHVQFYVDIQTVDFHESGSDEITFYISPNVGENAKPLADIVSSGEAARIMLALKRALMDVDPIPVLIFDEIDAQIGGRLGGIIGKKLTELSQRRQVILITHLPQIASFASTHFHIYKTVADKRTITQVKELDQSERIEEIAKMMGSQKEDNITLSHAENMLKKATLT